MEEQRRKKEKGDALLSRVTASRQVVYTSENKRVAAWAESGREKATACLLSYEQGFIERGAPCMGFPTPQPNFPPLEIYNYDLITKCVIFLLKNVKYTSKMLWLKHTKSPNLHLR